MAQFTPDDLAAVRFHDLTGWALEGHRIGLESSRDRPPLTLEDAYLRLTGTDGLAEDAAIQKVPLGENRESLA